ncbi:MAG: ABC transporter ATP-binding protein [Candidatus Paceibacterota bacterium]|jgi:lipopolysaccharide transport system ATP-binding protein
MKKVIDIHALTKLYKIPHEKRTTLFETAVGYMKRQLSYESFYALQDISFSIQSGEIIGLIGKNGSGKTTLLKILGGVLHPTSGSCAIQGVVAPFLSLGVGFHHELTAEENLYLYGAILGLSRKEIKEKMPAILAFAEVERFKDMKLKHFSAGMTGRLAFALMTQTNPDILLIDEIFAVGDKDFTPKSLSLLQKYRDEGKTVIVASHSLDLIAQYADRVLLLENGKIKMLGTPKEVIVHYQSS